MMVQQLFREEEVGFVDLWDSFVGKEELYLRDGLHLSGKGAGRCRFCTTVRDGIASCLGKVRYLN